MDFTCVGFDVRKWPWSGEFNIDETGWEQSERDYSNLMEKFDLKENEYQLLEIQEKEQLLKISEYIEKKESCNLVAVELSTEIVRIQDTRYGYNTASTKVDLVNFTCRGFDVCDFEGFFSILHNPRLERNSSALFSEAMLIQALELAQIANVLDLNHAPFVVAKISSLK